MSASIAAPYKPLQKENIKMIEKFKKKIDQQARKDIVLSQVANPKVSEI